MLHSALPQRSRSSVLQCPRDASSSNGKKFTRASCSLVFVVSDGNASRSLSNRSLVVQDFVEVHHVPFDMNFDEMIRHL